MSKKKKPSRKKSMLQVKGTGLEVKDLEDFLNRLESETWVGICTKDGSSYLLLAPVLEIIENASVIDRYCLSNVVRYWEIKHADQEFIHQKLTSYAPILKRRLVKVILIREAFDMKVLKIVVEGDDKGQQWMPGEKDKTIQLYHKRYRLLSASAKEAVTAAMEVVQDGR